MTPKDPKMFLTRKYAAAMGFKGNGGGWIVNMNKPGRPALCQGWGIFERKYWPKVVEWVKADPKLNQKYGHLIVLL